VSRVVIDWCQSSQVQTLGLDERNVFVMHACQLFMCCYECVVMVIVVLLCHPKVNVEMIDVLNSLCIIYVVLPQIGCEDEIASHKLH